MWENATNGLTASINVWSYDQQASNFTFAATSSNTSLATVSVSATNQQSATNVLYTLTFALATNNSGSSTIQLVAGEGSLSTTNTFTLNVTLINHAPSFTLATNLVLVTEESAAVTNTGFVVSWSKGPPNQSGATFTFTDSTPTNSPTNAHFAVLPKVDTNGTLIFQPSAHSFGTNTVTMIMTISGGTTNGGVNACTNTYQIAVAQTNHAPVIVGATNHTVLENATSATALISVWDYDAQGSNYVFTATSSNPGLVTVAVRPTHQAQAM